MLKRNKNINNKEPSFIGLLKYGMLKHIERYFSYFLRFYWVIEIWDVKTPTKKIIFSDMFYWVIEIWDVKTIFRKKPRNTMFYWVIEIWDVKTGLPP